MYEEQSDSELEEKESEYIPEEIKQIKEPKKKLKQLTERRTNIFVYLNNNAKRNKW